MSNELARPIKVGNLELKNRLVMSPMVTNYATRDGYVTSTLKDYLVERAKGGVALIITEATCIDAPTGKGTPNMLCIDDDRYVPGLKELAQAVKAEGARIAIQLDHMGSMARSAVTGVTPVSASAVPLFLGKETPHELTIEEIEQIIEKYGQGARRAKEAGFDAIEIHTGFYYLLGQFLSPVRNLRKDKYGGNLEGRLRLTLDILKRIRQEVGEGFPVSCKFIAPFEGMEDEAEIHEVERRLEAAGVDLLHRIGYSPVVDINGPRALSGARPMRVPRAYAVDLAAKAKAVVKIPVMAVGRINSPGIAEEIIKEGKADLIGLGRALLADPEFARKALEGRAEDIRPCIACCRCVATVYESKVRCSVNPALGREEELRIRPAERRRNVVVIGGGPAGMEAARVAALRGHHVSLYEAKRELGGQLLLLSNTTARRELKDLLSYLKKQLDTLGVEVRLNETVTPSLLRVMRPDVIVLATGAQARLPAIRGVRRNKVATAFDFLEGKAAVGNNVAVVGGGLIGCEVADYLAGQDKKVTVLEMFKELASGEALLPRYYLLESLKAKGVRMLTETKVEAITEEGLLVRTPRGGETITADSVIFAVGEVPNEGLARELTEKDVEVYCAGDCFEPRRIINAIHEGYLQALKL